MIIHLITPLLTKHNRKGEASQKEHVTNLLMVELLKAMEAASHDETILKAKEKFKVLVAGEEGGVSPEVGAGLSTIKHDSITKHCQRHSGPRN